MNKYSNMTLEEISEELGHSVNIIKDDNGTIVMTKYIQAIELDSGEDSIEIYLKNNRHNINLVFDTEGKAIKTFSILEVLLCSNLEVLLC